MGFQIFLLMNCVLNTRKLWEILELYVIILYHIMSWQNHVKLCGVLLNIFLSRVQICVFLICYIARKTHVRENLFCD